jgi:N6-adenosine-specific RNA methylase IME4
VKTPEQAKPFQSDSLLKAASMLVVSPTSIQSARGRHSEKPHVIYTLLERMYPEFTECDRIELFARQARAGWQTWGNEVQPR